MSYFLSAGIFPFTVALIVLGLAVIMDLVLTPLKASPFKALDKALMRPETESPASGIQRWVPLGRISSLTLISFFLGCFAAAGMLIQSIAVQAIGTMADVGFVVLLATALGINGMMRLAKNMEKRAAGNGPVDIKNLKGCIATITKGTAQHGQPAEATIVDGHKIRHTIMVEPSTNTEVFDVGTSCEILRLKTDESAYLAIGLKTRL